MQNDSYSLSIVKKLTAGKERWTITKTDGGHTDIGVISEEVEKLTLKSDISTIKPTRIVTPDESAAVFEMLLRKSRLHSWKFRAGLILVLLTPGIVLGMFIEQFFEWFLFGGLLLGFLVAATVVALSNPTYDVTDGAGVNIGVVYKDVKASLLRKKCVIETQYGRWRLAETSSSQLILRLTVSFVTLWVAGVLTAFEYNDISDTISFVVLGITVVFIRLFSGKMNEKELLLTLTNESGVQVGSTTFVNGGYDIQVQDQRLDQRVAVAAGLITADYTDS